MSNVIEQVQGPYQMRVHTILVAPRPPQMRFLPALQVSVAVAAPVKGATSQAAQPPDSASGLEPVQSTCQNSRNGVTADTRTAPVKDFFRCVRCCCPSGHVV